jgi:hypothetical protein
MNFEARHKVKDEDGVGKPIQARSSSRSAGPSNDGPKARKQRPNRLASKKAREAVQAFWRRFLTAPKAAKPPSISSADAGRGTAEMLTARLPVLSP